MANLFEKRNAEVSDSGYLYTFNDGNIAADGITTSTGTTDSGAINEMFDNNNTTYYGVNRSAAGAGTVYLTINLLKRYDLAVVNAYFSGYLGSTGSTVTVTIQYSEDGTTWIDGPNVSRSSVGETFANYNAQVTLQYLRLKIYSTGPDPVAGRMYHLRVTKK